MDVKKDMAMPSHPRSQWPQIGPLGLDGVLVRFGDALSEASNRAAIAFHAVVLNAYIDGLAEASISLTSVYIRFDLGVVDPRLFLSLIEEMALSREWTSEPLPQGRKRWTIPACFGGEHGPQLEEAADLAGVRPDQAIDQIVEHPLRVLTIGFGPGQPYLGELPQNWQIPRQSTLTDQVPVGALTVAIRQLVLFSMPSPTGWRHIAQTAFRPFQLHAQVPFVLSAGDEVSFEPVTAKFFAQIDPDDLMGGARSELIDAG